MCFQLVAVTLGGNGRFFRAAAMAEVGQMSPVGRFLLSVAFSGVLLSTISTLDAKKVCTRVVESLTYPRSPKGG